MSPLLKDFLNKRVVVVTTDGQCFIALLEGFDKNTNLLLSDVRERFNHALVASSYLMRGTQVVCCGLLSEQGDLGFMLPSTPASAPSSGQAPTTALKDTKNRIPNEHQIWEKVWAAKTAK